MVAVVEVVFGGDGAMVVEVKVCFCAYLALFGLLIERNARIF